MSRVVSGRDVTWRDVPVVGSKAVNLARLGRSGQPVPPWYAVTTEALAQARATCPDVARVAERLAAGDPLESVGRGVREALASVPLPNDLAREIQEAHRSHFSAEAFVAVRSSGTSEDSADASFAGLHDSFLFVRGGDALLDAIRRVWASAYSDRALAYRMERGLPLGEIDVGVLVQEMVNAQASGVLFTVNPTTGDYAELVLSSLWGAGEGLVSAGLDADTFVVDRDTLEIATTPAVKETRLVPSPDGADGLVEEGVPEGERDAPSLTPAQIRSVARAGLAIEREFRVPQDIEFSFDAAGKLHVLQARPVTTVDELGPAAGNRILWDNSNIIESYSGVTSPMTFSFIRHAYSTVYHCFCEVMGIAPSVIRSQRRMFRSMLGLVRGQVYYHILNWHRLVKLFPGYEYNRGFMESMMGVRESTSLTPPPAAGWQRRYFQELPALIRLVLRSGWNFLRIRTIVGDFEARFRRLHGRWEAMDFSTMAPHDLLDVYREMEEDLLSEWKAPIINDFYVMIFYGTLKKLCVSWCADEVGTLQNDLLCGEGGLASTEPARRLLRLAATARQQPELRDVLVNGNPEQLAVELPRDSRFPEFRRELASYLDEFGYRCADELKLEEPSLKDRPAFLYRMVQNYLAADDASLFDLEAQDARERQVRTEAEARAYGSPPLRSRLRRAVFVRVLRSARLGVKNRENLRLARTRVYGTLRELIRALGDRLTEARELDAPEDVFLLTLDEVHDFVLGTAVTTDLKGLANLRRREFHAYRTEPEKDPHDRFVTYGMVYHRNRFQERRPAATGAEDGVLRGTACCPGTVTGPVKVILSLAGDASISGEILVAGRTDPGWVALYPAVSGLLIERGSILSHSAIVAREMGIPTIVGIPGLTSTLQTGQRVTMDGAAGTVRLLTDDDHEDEGRDEEPTSAGTDPTQG